MFPQNKNQKGAALLVNLLVTIAIIAMVMTLSVPYLKKYQTSIKLNGAAKDMTADIRLAQQLTITEQVAYQVQFSTSTNAYSIVKTGAATSTIKTVSLPSQISFQSVSPNLGGKVLFNSFGGVSQSGSVILQNIDSKTSTINIKPSGYVQLIQ